MIHPAARLLIAGGWAVAVETAAPPVFFLLVAASLLAGVHPAARVTFLRLLRRTRWLVAILVLTYAWTLPGVPLWPALGALSPSVGGLDAGLWRAGRLLLMLAGTAVLLATTPAARLIYGLYVLATPFARVGLDPRAFAVRLGLTLAEAEYARAPLTLSGLRERLYHACADESGTLADPRADAANSVDTYCLTAERWRLHDIAVLGCAAAGVVMLVLGHA